MDIKRKRIYYENVMDGWKWLRIVSNGGFESC